MKIFKKDVFFLFYRQIIRTFVLEILNLNTIT